MAIKKPAAKKTTAKNKKAASNKAAPKKTKSTSSEKHWAEEAFTQMSKLTEESRENIKDVRKEVSLIKEDMQKFQAEITAKNKEISNGLDSLAEYLEKMMGKESPKEGLETDVKKAH